MNILNITSGNTERRYHLENGVYAAIHQKRTATVYEEKGRIYRKEEYFDLTTGNLIESNIDCYSDLMSADDLKELLSDLENKNLVLKKRIQDQVKKEYHTRGKIGTESIGITITLSESELEQFMSVDLDCNFSWELDGNELFITYSEKLINVNGAWYVDALPTEAVIEFENGNLAKFAIVPFRELKEFDFTDYKDYHPRKCKGQPLPAYLFKFYGLKKNDESASEVIHVRVTPTEKQKVQDAARDKNVSEFIRDYIKSL